MPDQEYISEKCLVKTERALLGWGERLTAGICLSGGGIRSATFNLGILQELDRLDLLKYFDYLSTVSGGGYIGSWFAACKKNGVPVSRFTPDGENPAFRHLRRYSRYLTPESGLFSLDTLTTLGIILRNMLLNQGVLCAFLATVLMIPRALRWGFEQSDGPCAGPLLFVSSFLLFALGVGYAIRGLDRVGTDSSAEQSEVMRWFVVPISAASMLFAVTFWRQSEFLLSHAWLKYVAAAVFALLSIAAAWFSMEKGTKRGKKIRVALLSALAPTSMSWIASTELRELSEKPWFGVNAAVVVMPAVLLIVAAAIVLSMIGLMGRDLDDGKREWWSRAGAAFTVLAAAWTLVSGIALYVPPLWDSVGGLGGAAAAAASWAGTGLGVYKLASSLAERSKEKESGGGLGWLLAVGSLVSTLFILGTLCLVAILNEKLVTWVHYQWWGVFPLVTTFIGLLIVTYVFGVRFDVNEFSMNHFYRNRLVRCYMGAARHAERQADKFTGLDFEDDFCISKLNRNVTGYAGPFHIVNTSLNLARPSDLAMQDRKADSFSITPLYCGSPSTGYRLTNRYIYGTRSIKLGTAMAISGAAANPNMGNLTAAPLAFVMTLFNVRLGWWVPHPERDTSGAEPAPKFALYYLLKELFAATTVKDEYLNLSDGGHFENLGAYELVRRRCHLIVIGDGGADPNYHFDDLGNFIRLCRLDFNTEIDLALSPIGSREGRFGKSHCVVGKILYPDGPPGTLVYLKSSLCGDEPPDVLHYATNAMSFPHETTADQFFSEEQFESYRALGEHIARETFEKAKRDWGITEGDPDLKAPSIENFTRALRQAWFAPARAAGNFTRHTEALDRIWDQLRSNKQVGFLDAQLFPSWPDLMRGTWPKGRINQWLPRSERELREAFYLSQSILQLMENVYVDCDLEREHQHPDNRGWMNLFRHWAGSSMLRIAWALTCQTYGARFQSFMRRELDLSNQDGIEIREVELDGCNRVEADLVAREGMSPAGARRLFGIFVKVQPPVHGGDPFQFRVGLLAGTLAAGGKPAVLHWIRIQAQLRNMGVGTAAVARFRTIPENAKARLVRDPKLANPWIRALVPETTEDRS